VKRLLLDTHLVLWWLNGDLRLPQPVLERAQAPEAEVVQALASVSEPVMAQALGLVTALAQVQASAQA
jgi:PIN domain nuclease of toxin-antitoxin system